MSFQAMTWAIALRLPTRDKFVLLMLANRASNENGDCYPSLSMLCDETGMSRPTIIEALRSLEEAGAISVHRQRAGDVNLPNVYRLNFAFQGGGKAALPVVNLTQGGSKAALPESINEPITKEEKRARVRWTGDAFDIPASIMATFADAYASRVDVRREIDKATAWCRTNPQRAPRREYGRFLNAWLNRAAARPVTKTDKREAFMEGLFGKTPDVIDVSASVVG